MIRRVQNNDSFAIMRPACRDDVTALRSVSGSIEIGNSRDNTVESGVILSIDFLRGGSTLNSGGHAFFATKNYENASNFEISGHSKIQLAFEGHWCEKAESFGHDGKALQRKMLVFEFDRRRMLELGGNAVKKNHRGKGNGTLQTEGRLLFLLVHNNVFLTEGKIDGVLADFLTVKSMEGHYQLFDLLTGPCLGNIRYDEADKARSGNGRSSALFTKAFHSKEAQIRIPLNTVRAICPGFGQVAKETIPAKHLLEKYGFRHEGRYDALDGGLIVEIGTERLLLTDVRNARVQPLDRSDLPGNATAMTICRAEGNPNEFIAVRSVCVVDGSDLFVPKDVFEAAELTRGEKIAFLSALATNSGWSITEATYLSKSNAGLEWPVDVISAE